jgi:hypothetical protein
MDHILEGLEAIVEAKAPRNFEFRLNRPSIGGDDIVGETWVTESGYPDLNDDGIYQGNLGNDVRHLEIQVGGERSEAKSSGGTRIKATTRKVSTSIVEFWLY